MIANVQEPDVTQKRIAHFQHLLEQIGDNASPAQLELMASGYRLESERMQAEVMDYLLRPIERPVERQTA